MLCVLFLLKFIKSSIYFFIHSLVPFAINYSYIATPPPPATFTTAEKLSTERRINRASAAQKAPSQISVLCIFISSSLQIGYMTAYKNVLPGDEQSFSFLYIIVIAMCLCRFVCACIYIFIVSYSAVA
jgi:hypothetical protein